MNGIHCATGVAGSERSRATRQPMAKFLSVLPGPFQLSYDWATTVEHLELPIVRLTR